MELSREFDSVMSDKYSVSCELFDLTLVRTVSHRIFKEVQRARVVDCSRFQDVKMIETCRISGKNFVLGNYLTNS